jgi:chitin synthase
MSLPERPGTNPGNESRHAYRNSPSRRNRPADIESGGYRPVNARGQHHQRGKSASSYAETIPYSNANVESMPLSPTDPHGHARQPRAEQPFSRKRSLIRPERNRIGKDHRNYHYHKHAANMAVLPSSTGNDPLLEIEASTDRSGESQTNDNVSERSPRGSGSRRDRDRDEKPKEHVKRAKSGKVSKDPKRHSRRKSKSKGIDEQIRQRL